MDLYTLLLPNQEFRTNQLTGLYAIGASNTGEVELTQMILLNAALGHYLIYNRALTDAEVLQNYNATKAKFGL
jgi:hypothetical protein